MSWNKSDYVKEGLFYVKPIDKTDSDQKWASERYGAWFINLGDLIYDTLRNIIERDDKSDWAYESFEECSILLYDNERWPDEMQEGLEHRIAKNSLEEIWLKCKYRKEHKLHGEDGTPPEHPIKYRPQHQVTRDPWILKWACAVHLGLMGHINEKPPLKLYDPGVWRWRRGLLGECEWKPSKGKNKPEYVRDLDRIMEEAIYTLKNK